MRFFGGQAEPVTPPPNSKKSGAFAESPLKLVNHQESKTGDAPTESAPKVVIHQKPFQVAVFGRGPEGFTFAIILAEWAKLRGIPPSLLHIQLIQIGISKRGSKFEFEVTDGVQGRTVKNRRREQAETIRHTTKQLFDTLSPETRQALEGDKVRRSSDSVSIRDLEDHLIARVQAQDVQAYVELKECPAKLRDDARDTKSTKVFEKEVKDFLSALGCDLVVGADGDNSMLRRTFEAWFECQEDDLGTDYALGIGFEGMQGCSGLNALLTMSQNRYHLNSCQHGKKGYLKVRLSEEEFETLQSKAGGPYSVPQPCEMWDVMKETTNKDKGKIPLYHLDAWIKEVVQQGERCFDIPEHLATNMVLVKTEPQRVKNFWIPTPDRDGGQQLNVLIGDAAMSHHFWSDRGLDTGLRASVALAWAVLDTLIPGPRPQAFMAASLQEHMQVYQDYMTRLGDEIGEEWDDMPLPPDSAQLQAAEAAKQDCLSMMRDRVVEWRDSMQQAPLRTLGRDEREIGWPHLLTSDAEIDERFYGMSFASLASLAPITLKTMVERNYPTGWAMPRAPEEQLPVEPDWLSQKVHLIATAQRDRAQYVEDLQAREQARAQEASRYISARAHDQKLLRESEASPTEQYDSALEIDQFLDVSKEGWPILKDDPECAEEKQPRVTVTCVGNFKKGKTWFSNHLAKLNLPSSSVRHTPGLCSKMVDIQGKKCRIVDTKGENTPLSHLGKEKLQEKKVEESFLRDVVCDLSDAFFYVVGQMGYQEQLTLAQLKEELDSYVQRKLKTTPTIIMVHNLMGINRLQELQEEWSKIKAIYKPEGYAEEEHWMKDPNTGLDVRIEYLSKALERGDVFGVQINHFYLGQEFSPAGAKNEATIEAIRNRIIFNLPPVNRPTNFLEELRSTMNHKIQSYFTTSDAFEVVREEDRFVLQKLPRSEEVPPATSSPPVVPPPFREGDKPTVALSGGSKPAVKLHDVPLGHFVSSSLPQNHTRYRLTTTQQKKVCVAVDLPGSEQQVIERCIRKGKKLAEQNKPSPIVVSRLQDANGVNVVGVNVVVKPGAIQRPLRPGEREIHPEVFDANAATVIPVSGWHMKDALRPDIEVVNGIVTLTWDVEDDDADDSESEEDL